MKMTMRMLVGAAVLGIVLALTGCTQGNVKAPAELKTGAASSAAAPTPTVTPTPTPTAASTYKFGDTVKWDKGLELTVSAPTAFKPSKTSMGGDQAVNLAFTITIKNGGTEPFDPGIVNATATSGNVEASHVYDSAQGIGSSPSTKVLPGRTVTWKIGMSVANASDIVMEVTPDFEHDSAIYTT